MNSESTYLDCGGLTYPQVLDLQDLFQQAGISSNVSTGSLHVHLSPDELMTQFPNLKDRVLGPAGMPFAMRVSEALKNEKANQL